MATAAHLLSFEAFEGPTVGTRYDTTSADNKITVGRTKASKLHVDDETVSERHGVLLWNQDTGTWSITDLNSSNGTAVNGITLEPQGGEGWVYVHSWVHRCTTVCYTSPPISTVPCTLKEGDVVRFGNSKLRVQVHTVQ